MQNIEQSRGLGRASIRGNVNVNQYIIAIFVYQHLRDVIHVSPSYVQDFRSLAVPTPPLQIKYFIFQV